MCKDCQNYKPIPHPLDQMISDYTGTHITIDDLKRFRYECIKWGWASYSSGIDLTEYLENEGHKDWIPNA